MSIPKSLKINKLLLIGLDPVGNDRVRYDRVRNDRVRNDRVRNDRGLEMIGSFNICSYYNFYWVSFRKCYIKLFNSRNLFLVLKQNFFKIVYQK